MPLNFRLFEQKDTEFWEAFVTTANNGTIFHERKFINYHPPGRFVDHSLIIEKNGKPLAVFPAAEIVRDKKRWLISHPGASYGSFVYPLDLSFSDSYELVAGLKHYANSQKFDAIRLTLPPAIYQQRVSNYIDFALVKHGFEYAKRDVSSMLTIEATPDENLAKFRSTHRTAVRKAIRQGVEIRQSDDYVAFYDILKHNLKIRHGVTPTHTLNELIQLKDMYPDKISLHAAFHDGTMVAGVVNFVVNPQVVLAFYISHDEEYQHLRAVNLLFFEIIKWSHAQGTKYLDFGIFTVDMEPNFGLGRFKENFGASGVFRDTFQCVL
ncbi:MAG: GNAT family N-acetyltransferase [Candidatus Marinimicrobia bacterium CG1_02_48_14]|nr:MAG: GNAT family N-acetyltransferase [Candidatus Marinimicrobia bacterium CG1_02_48_14]